MRPPGPAPRFLAVLVLGVACVSTGVLWVRLAECEPLAKAAWRCGLATLLLWPLARREARSEASRGGSPEAPRGPGAIAAQGGASVSRGSGAWGLALGAGLFLAFHFATWIASLDHTSVAASVLLVNTTPVWVTLVSPWVTSDRPDRRTWSGVLLCLLGAGVLAAGDGLQDGFTRGRGLGNGLALLGALGWAGYALLGRRVGGRLPLWTYLRLCYGTAAVVLLLLCLVDGTPLLGLGARTHLALVLLAVVPQTLGHSTLNWALRHLPTSSVSAVATLEPLFASLLAWAFLAEVPPQRALWAAPLVLGGIALATGRRRRPRAAPLSGSETGRESEHRPGSEGSSARTRR